MSPDLKKLETNVQRVFDRAMAKVRLMPTSLRQKLPRALRAKDFKTGIWITDRFIFAYVNDIGGMTRFKTAIKTARNPFPGLFSNHPKEGSAFALNNSKFVTIDRCEAQDIAVLNMGPDCTAIINELSYKFSNDPSQRTYKIPLAYIVSFGTEITIANAEKQLDDLIAYSYRQEWIGGQQ